MGRKLYLFALSATSFALNRLSKTDMEQHPVRDFRILVAGGSLYAKENGIHSSCELLTISFDGLVRSAPFSSLNIPRRGANCVVVRKGKAASRIWIIGGCTDGPDSTVRHLDSAEYFDYDPRDSSIRKREAGCWCLFPNLLNIGRSCFSAAAVASENSDDDMLLVLGGWNGVECLSNVECIRLKVDDDERMTNNSSPTPQIETASTGGATQRATSTTTTATLANDSDECVSTADLISPIKNGCTLVVVEEVERRQRVSILLIGGWDGKRTLNTIFRYTFAGGSSLKSGSPQLHRLLPYEVECHASVLHENEAIYVIGGFDGVRLLDSIVRIDLKTESVSVLPTKLAVARECHCAEILVTDGDKREPLLVVLGGWDGYKALRSVEIFRVIDREPYLVPVNVTDDALLQARNRACSVVLSNS